VVQGAARPPPLVWAVPGDVSSAAFRVVAALIRDGDGRVLLVRKRGVGTKVVNAKVRRKVELTSLWDDLAKTGRGPSTRVVSFRTEAAPDAVAATLGLPAGTPVYVFERLRYADRVGMDIWEDGPAKNRPPGRVLGGRPAHRHVIAVHHLLRGSRRSALPPESQSARS